MLLQVLADSWVVEPLVCSLINCFGGCFSCSSAVVSEKLVTTPLLVCWAMATVPMFIAFMVDKVGLLLLSLNFVFRFLKAYIVAYETVTAIAIVIAR